MVGVLGDGVYSEVPSLLRAHHPQRELLSTVSPSPALLLVAEVSDDV